MKLRSCFVSNSSSTSFSISRVDKSKLESTDKMVQIKVIANIMLETVYSDWREDCNDSTLRISNLISRFNKYKNNLKKYDNKGDPSIGITFPSNNFDTYIYYDFLGTLLIKTCNNHKFDEVLYSYFSDNHFDSGYECKEIDDNTNTESYYDSIFFDLKTGQLITPPIYLNSRIFKNSRRCKKCRVSPHCLVINGNGSLLCNYCGDVIGKITWKKG